MTAVIEQQTVITEPGVYPGIADDDYHRDRLTTEPTLSASGAKKLLPPNCPAIFKWERDNPPAPKKEFDFGHAAHRLCLGAGLDIEVIDAPDWRTKAAKEAAEDARTRGFVPLLPHDMERIDAMAQALRAHPIASRLLQPGTGTPEASLYWREPVTNVMRRGRLDWLPDNASSLGRLLITDYKTCNDPNPAAFAAAAARYRYHLQAATYIEGVTTLGLAEEAVLLFIAQAKEPPYLVAVYELDQTALRIGRALNRRAVDLFVECQTRDEWPGYADDIEQLSLPRWAEYEIEETR